MPEYLAPGVYIEEIERGPKPIAGAATSTAAFLGETERGPVRPRLVTSYNDYLRLFGDVFAAGKYMPYAVKSFFDNGGRRCYITRIVGGNAQSATATIDAYSVTALGPGDAANRIFMRLEPGTLEVQSAPIGFRLRLYYWDRPLTQPPTFDDNGNVESLPPPLITEDFNDLTLDPDHPNYWDKRVNNGNSSLVTLAVDDGAALPNAATTQQLADGAPGDLPGTNAFEGGAPIPEDRRGLAALNLDPYREVAIVHAPGASEDVARAVITHCERNRFRFAVLDSPSNFANANNLDPRTTIQDTQYAAFYYPWIRTNDPRTGARVTIPPGGSVCGIYAQTDNTRGVFKAPANVVVSGALDLEYDIDHGTQEVLNPRGVNVTRRFPGRGIRVWGARTLSSNPLWQYVSVRRLFIFIERSIYDGTQWVVFENNDQRLWERIRQTVSLFLRTQWREGALFGASEEEAFLVNVGRDTMTSDDILNGRLIIEVGIAPVRPAEFVIFRVFQKTQEAKA
ncbi:phage tail sheath family protein [Ruegeria sp. MALMAid1280]|uniref:phage tail sheath family protein n=1 Tax=Ruegeria sp. MALMAid1280 TaxID=3411634 RepID=UPI003BA0542F